jgi:5-dehydro-2-deoxygluconokinase
MPIFVTKTKPLETLFNCVSLKRQLCCFVKMTTSIIKQNSFLVLGRAGIDLYADPPGTEIELASRFSAALGGSAANTAAAITRLGGKAALISCVSNDAVGRFTLKQLRDYDIDTRYVRSVAGEVRNSLAVVETRAQNCQSVIYRNNAADFQLEPQPLDFSGIGALIVTGTALAVSPSREATFDAISQAKAAGVPVILDVDFRPYSWNSAEEAAVICLKAAELSDIVVGNDEEFAVMVPDAGLALASQLAQNSAAIVVYKLGPLGSQTFVGGAAFTTPIFPVTALKPTGAGDSFLGALVTSLATGHSVETAVRRGSAAAAIVVTRVGCAPSVPTETELTAFLTAHES